ncbi:hypothetical protein Vretifemale_12114 [Volvox reticuliferus]|uniref:Uncharacterized protein n=1 Tax=Volvox reticuliferus TaxID=1737510 RepID=A0A8J4FQM1_9CHLO|nr:hypothetical protein Vretifemale_12114 [Volvox reticuliferus]
MAAVPAIRWHVSTSRAAAHVSNPTPHSSCSGTSSATARFRSTFAAQAPQTSCCCFAAAVAMTSPDCCVQVSAVSVAAPVAPISPFAISARPGLLLLLPAPHPSQSYTAGLSPTATPTNRQRPRTTPGCVRRAVCRSLYGALLPAVLREHRAAFPASTRRTISKLQLPTESSGPGS